MQYIALFVFELIATIVVSYLILTPQYRSTTLKVRVVFSLVFIGALVMWSLMTDQVGDSMRTAVAIILAMVWAFTLGNVLLWLFNSKVGMPLQRVTNATRIIYFAVVLILESILLFILHQNRGIEVEGGLMGGRGYAGRIDRKKAARDRLTSAERQPAADQDRQAAREPQLDMPLPPKGISIDIMFAKTPKNARLFFPGESELTLGKFDLNRRLKEVLSTARQEIWARLQQKYIQKEFLSQNLGRTINGKVMKTRKDLFGQWQFYIMFGNRRIYVKYKAPQETLFEYLKRAQVKLLAQANNTAARKVEDISEGKDVLPIYCDFGGTLKDVKEAPVAVRLFVVDTSNTDMTEPILPATNTQNFIDDQYVFLHSSVATLLQSVQLRLEKLYNFSVVDEQFLFALTNAHISWFLNDLQWFADAGRTKPLQIDQRTESMEVGQTLETELRQEAGFNPWEIFGAGKKAVDKVYHMVNLYVGNLPDVWKMRAAGEFKLEKELAEKINELDDSIKTTFFIECNSDTNRWTTNVTTHIHFKPVWQIVKMCYRAIMVLIRDESPAETSKAYTKYKYSFVPCDQDENPRPSGAKPVVIGLPGAIGGVSFARPTTPQEWFDLFTDHMISRGNRYVENTFKGLIVKPKQPQEPAIKYIKPGEKLKTPEPAIPMTATAKPIPFIKVVFEIPRLSGRPGKKVPANKNKADQEKELEELAKQMVQQRYEPPKPEKPPERRTSPSPGDKPKSPSPDQGQEDDDSKRPVLITKKQPQKPPKSHKQAAQSLLGDVDDDKFGGDGVSEQEIEVIDFKQDMLGSQQDAKMQHLESMSMAMDMGGMYGDGD